MEAGGVQLADGGWLVPSEDGTAGKEEFYRYIYKIKWLRLHLENCDLIYMTISVCFIPF